MGLVCTLTGLGTYLVRTPNWNSVLLYPPVAIDLPQVLFYLDLEQHKRFAETVRKPTIQYE